MPVKRKKTAARAMFVYIVLTAGIWMFLYSYTNSYNKLTEDKITPASLIVTDNAVRLNVLTNSCTLNLDWLSPENRLYTAAYLAAPDELRDCIKLVYAFSRRGNRYFSFISS